MFFKCRTAEETKKVFRQLALFLHPDKGGDTELMILLQDAYESHLNAIGFIENINSKAEPKKKQNHQTQPGTYQNVYEDVKEGDECLKIFEDIFEYAKTNKKFDPKYCKSLLEYLNKNGYITDSQYNGLVRIYYSFRMHEKKDEKMKEKT